MLKAAFVVQRYGHDVNGGAELLCRQVAERMTAFWDVHVLTTCAVDYMTWADAYPPGESTLDGVTVHRFPVDFPRCVPLFNRLSRNVLEGDRRLMDLLDRWVYEQGPYSSQFLRYLEAQRHQFDLFVFFTYLYGTTYYGLPEVADKAILVPAAHDEPPFHLPIYRKIFEIPRAIFFLTQEEQDMVLAKFDLKTQHTVVGAGIDEPEPADGAAMRQRIGAPYLLYVGRIDESKGCGELFAFFNRYKARRKGRLKLVLVGKAVMDVPESPDIVPLGFVDDAGKVEAIAGAEAMVVPSPYESLSLILLEGWMQGRPALVNGRCAVLAGHCERSGGGASYRSYDEFEKALDRVLGDPALARTQGEAGQAYVRERYRFDKVLERYREWGDRLAQ